jgi:uncharacterized protein
MREIIGLALGLVMGYVAQRSRFCIQGSFRDLFLFKDTYLVKGYVTALLAFSLVWIFGYAHSA